MSISSRFLQGYLLLFLLCWALPEASAEWRQEEPAEVQKQEKQPSSQTAKKQKRNLGFGEFMLGVGTALFVGAVLFGLVATIIFGIGGLTLWGIIALSCGLYAGGFGLGAIIVSNQETGMSAFAGILLGFLGVSASILLISLPLFILALIVGTSWISLVSGVLLGVVGLTFLIVLLNL